MRQRDARKLTARRHHRVLGVEAKPRPRFVSRHRVRGAASSLMLILFALAPIGCRDEGIALDTGRLEAAIASSLALEGENVGGLRSSLDQAAMEARRVTARESERPSYLRNDDVIVEAWLRAMHLAHQYASIVREQQRALELGWQSSSERAREALDQARSSSERLNGRDVSLHLRRATDSFVIAERLAETGDLESAITHAERSIEASNEVISLAGSALARFNDPDLMRLWAGWVDEAMRLSRDRAVILVDKLGRTAHVYRNQRRIDSFSVELGSSGLDRKLHAGDRATPEGVYHVVEVRKAPATRFFRALVLDYPNAEDRRRYEQARREGRIPARVPIGGLIEIHGEGGQERDWTNGCVALRNAEMDRLAQLVSEGTPVVIVGRIP